MVTATGEDGADAVTPDGGDADGWSFGSPGAVAFARSVSSQEKNEEEEEEHDAAEEEHNSQRRGLAPAELGRSAGQRYVDDSKASAAPAQGVAQGTPQTPQTPLKPAQNNVQTGSVIEVVYPEGALTSLARSLGFSLRSFC